MIAASILNLNLVLKLNFFLGFGWMTRQRNNTDFAPQDGELNGLQQEPGNEFGTTNQIILNSFRNQWPVCPSLTFVCWIVLLLCRYVECSLLRTKMLQFVQNYEYYMMSEVIEPYWHLLENNLKNVSLIIVTVSEIELVSLPAFMTKLVTHHLSEITPDIYRAHWAILVPRPILQDNVAWAWGRRSKEGAKL